jgi:hypothetical protein
MSGCRSTSIFLGRAMIGSRLKALSEPMVAAYQTIQMDTPS